MIEWTKQDSDFLQAYLQKSDYKLIKRLRELVPKATGGDFQQVALSAMVKQGAEDILEGLDELYTVQRQPESKSQYFDTTVGLTK